MRMPKDIRQDILMNGWDIPFSQIQEATANSSKIREQRQKDFQKLNRRKKGHWKKLLLCQGGGGGVAAGSLFELCKGTNIEQDVLSLSSTQVWQSSNHATSRSRRRRRPPPPTTTTTTFKKSALNVSLLKNHPSTMKDDYERKTLWNDLDISNHRVSSIVLGGSTKNHDGEDEDNIGGNCITSPLSSKMSQIRHNYNSMAAKEGEEEEKYSESLDVSNQTVQINNTTTPTHTSDSILPKINHDFENDKDIPCCTNVKPVDNEPSPNSTPNSTSSSFVNESTTDENSIHKSMYCESTSNVTLDTLDVSLRRVKLPMEEMGDIDNLDVSVRTIKFTTSTNLDDLDTPIDLANNSSLDDITNRSKEESSHVDSLDFSTRRVNLRSLDYDRSMEQSSHLDSLDFSARRISLSSLEDIPDSSNTQSSNIRTDDTTNKDDKQSHDVDSLDFSSRRITLSNIPDFGMSKQSSNVSTNNTANKSDYQSHDVDSLDFSSRRINLSSLEDIPDCSNTRSSHAKIDDTTNKGVDSLDFSSRQITLSSLEDIPDCSNTQSSNIRTDNTTQVGHQSQDVDSLDFSVRRITLSNIPDFGMSKQSSNVSTNDTANKADYQSQDVDSLDFSYRRITLSSVKDVPDCSNTRSSNARIDDTTNKDEYQSHDLDSLDFSSRQITLSILEDIPDCSNTQSSNVRIDDTNNKDDKQSHVDSLDFSTQRIALSSLEDIPDRSNEKCNNIRKESILDKMVEHNSHVSASSLDSSSQRITLSTLDHQLDSS